MTVIWAIPAGAAVVGMIVLLWGLRSIGAISAELRAQLELLSTVRVAVNDLRDERDRLRSSYEDLRSR